MDAFEEKIIPVSLNPKQVAWEKKNVEEMTKSKLKGYMDILKENQEPYYQPEMEMYMRFAIPMASFFFAMLGGPLGTQRQRTSSSKGFGISVIVIFVYYAIMAFCSGVGRSGTIPPVIAAMIPNLICFASGMYLLKRKNY